MITKNFIFCNIKIYFSGIYPSITAKFVKNPHAIPQIFKINRR